MLVIWIAICFMAYYVKESFHFYLIAILVGLVMGGIQSTSRAAYSKLLVGKKEDHLNSYYSFYEVLEKAAIVFGTFSFGLIDHVSGSMRNSVLALAIYFLIGLIILSTVELKKNNVFQDSNYIDPLSR